MGLCNLWQWYWDTFASTSNRKGRQIMPIHGKSLSCKASVAPGPNDLCTEIIACRSSAHTTPHTVQPWWYLATYCSVKKPGFPYKRVGGRYVEGYGDSLRTWKWKFRCVKVPKFQRFRASKFQSFRVFKVPKTSNVQSLKVFEVPKFQSVRVSKL